MSRLVTLRGCLEAVRDHTGIAKQGINHYLVDAIVQQILEHLAELRVHQFFPLPLTSNLQPDTMAAMLAVKYYDHQVHKKPLTQVGWDSFWCMAA